MGIFRDTKKDIKRRNEWLEIFTKKVDNCDIKSIHSAFLQGSDLEWHYHTYGISYETKENYKEKIHELIKQFEKNCSCSKK